MGLLGLMGLMSRMRFPERSVSRVVKWRGAVPRPAGGVVWLRGYGLSTPHSGQVLPIMRAGVPSS